MSNNIFDLFNSAFQLMSENKLKRDIDDTLLEKLLTTIENYVLQSSSINEENNITKSNSKEQSDFTEEFLNKTNALNLIEKVIFSFADKKDSYPTVIKAFVLRLIGLIYMSRRNFYPYKNLLPLFSCDQSGTDYNPSIQNALLYCLSCITKKIEGARFFIEHNLKDFVFSNFYSNSYYVRKSSVNFIANFILMWNIPELSGLEKLQAEENCLKQFVTDIIFYLIDHIHIYKTPKERMFSEGCIAVLQQLLEHLSFEDFIEDPLSLAKRVSGCFMDLTEDTEFNKKLTDLFLSIDTKFDLPADVRNDGVKCLILQEEIELAMHLASTFSSKGISTHGHLEGVNFFLLPSHILMGETSAGPEHFFTVKSDLVYDIVARKMEEKSGCKALVSASLNALQKTIPVLDSNTLRTVGSEILKVVKNSDNSQHKWLYAVLEDRMVHHSFVGFYTSMKSEDVYVYMKLEETDLVFQSILEFLKKPTTDSFFIAQLLFLMKDVLILQEKYEFEITDAERNSLIETLCRGLHDKRESVVDSAIHLAGQMMMSTAWKTKVCEHNILSTLWDFTIYGNLDGTIRSTALKVIVNGCLESWCMNEMKKLKDISEEDIVKILFDLTYDPDFFLQREALSSLYKWVKSKWDQLNPVSKDYIFSALVMAIRSLDLELKLLSLDIWQWLLENKLTFANLSTTLEIEEFVEKLAFSGFGLSLIHAVEDSDVAVQFKAAEMLNKLRKVLISKGYSLNSLPTNKFSSDRTYNTDMCDYLSQTYTKEEKEKGIDSVMEISTTDQISSICHQNLSEIYNFKQEYFLNDSEDRKCSLSAFWTCLWSESVVAILQPPEKNNCDMSSESLLKDIISAEMQEYGSLKDTPDCY